MTLLMETKSELKPRLTLSSSLCTVLLMTMASRQGLGLLLQRAKDTFFLSCLSLAQFFILVSDYQPGSSPLSLVSTSLGHVPYLKMQVIASRCGNLRGE